MNAELEEYYHCRDAVSDLYKERSVDRLDLVDMLVRERAQARTACLADDDVDRSLRFSVQRLLASLEGRDLEYEVHAAIAAVRAHF